MTLRLNTCDSFKQKCFRFLSIRNVSDELHEKKVDFMKEDSTGGL